VKEHPPLGTGEELPSAVTRWADPGYFSALGIPLVNGRSFTSDERVDRSYKVIVSRRLAQQYLPGEIPSVSICTFQPIFTRKRPKTWITRLWASWETPCIRWASQQADDVFPDA
jgi:hypothetical protein